MEEIVEDFCISCGCLASNEKVSIDEPSSFCRKCIDRISGQRPSALEIRMEAVEVE